MVYTFCKLHHSLLIIHLGTNFQNYNTIKTQPIIVYFVLNAFKFVMKVKSKLVDHNFKSHQNFNKFYQLRFGIKMSGEHILGRIYNLSLGKP